MSPPGCSARGAPTPPSRPMRSRSAPTHPPCMSAAKTPSRSTGRPRAAGGGSRRLPLQRGRRRRADLLPVRVERDHRDVARLRGYDDRRLEPGAPLRLYRLERASGRPRHDLPLRHLRRAVPADVYRHRPVAVLHDRSGRAALRTRLELEAERAIADAAVREARVKADAASLIELGEGALRSPTDEHAAVLKLLQVAHRPPRARSRCEVLADERGAHLRHVEANPQAARRRLRCRHPGVVVEHRDRAVGPAPHIRSSLYTAEVLRADTNRLLSVSTSIELRWK